MRQIMDTRKLEKQFVDFVTEYKQIIYKVCYIYATDSDSLNDLYQETVINLWKSFPRFRGECKASTWVYRIALNTCISFFRKSNSRPVVVPITIDLESAFADEEEKTSQLRELYRMINMLGKLERALILLWLEERSHQEIADILEMKEQSIYKRLKRGKKMLQDRLADMGVTYED
jgi:RNA polymerase sigma-70 factor (ECF subfamily)